MNTSTDNLTNEERRLREIYAEGYEDGVEHNTYPIWSDESDAYISGHIQGEEESNEEAFDD